MNDYTSRDKKNYGDTDVAKVAYPKFLEKLSVCRDKFHGYDYSKFQNGTDLERAKTISGAVNFITICTAGIAAILYVSLLKNANL